MPIDYYDDMSDVKRLCGTLSLMFRWKGSIYKILWKEVCAYFLTYIALGLIYKLALNDIDKLYFEMVAACCSKYADSIPVVLLLGFFTSTVMQRWWAVYSTIPGTGKMITLCMFYLKSNYPERGKCVRTFTRYMILSWMLCLRTTCPPLRNKYPTFESMERAGFLLKHEAKILEKTEPNTSRWSLHVINWAIALVRIAREKEYFLNPNDVSRVLDPIITFKKSCSSVLKYQITAIPLSFVQAVTLTVRMFGLVSLMGRQFYDLNTKLMVIDCFLPILPTMQYLAYLAWLKLAEVAANPFGEDDDDFDIIGLFDNHVNVADNLLVVFDLNENNPVLESMELTHLTRFKIHKGEALLPMNGEKPSETLNPKGEETPLMLPYIDDENAIDDDIKITIQ